MTLTDILFLRQPWLITPEAHAAMLAAVQSPRDGVQAIFKSPFDTEEDDDCDILAIDDGVGIIPIHGPMVRNPDLISRLLFGATGIEEIIYAVNAAAERPDIQAVFLDIDSPGGSVSGTPELAQAVADLCKSKYTYAFSGGQMCSAAYWVASQCDAIYVTPSARVGSIGVILPVVDSTEAYRQAGLHVEVFAAGKYKSTGMPGVALTDDQREWLQSDVEEIAADFRSAVLTRGRSIPVEAMEGQSFSARKAMRFNLAGTVKNRDAALAMLRSRHVAR
ncbi:MAG: S49 family peptidase [Chthoniobacteraceae bacterium]